MRDDVADAIVEEARNTSFGDTHSERNLRWYILNALEESYNDGYIDAEWELDP